MDKEIYEVTRDEYVGFLDQINPKSRLAEKEVENGTTSLRVLSIKTGKLLCERVISPDNEEQYYVYEMPDDDERIAPRPRMRIQLETKEEVQSFFDILSQLQKEADLKNGRIV